MIAILIDAVLLFVLLKVINNGDRDFMTSIMGAIAVSVGAPIMAFLMLLVAEDTAAIGDGDIIVAVTLAMTFLAGTVMLMFGVELKKSMLTAVLFSTIRFGLVFGLGSAAFS